uniref:Uncharacterized protein n=1 Tax=Lepeophtheirus salmonis TaxID=72036 RepID=A0A0K2TDM6_LEPSM
MFFIISNYIKSIVFLILLCSFLPSQISGTKSVGFVNCIDCDTFLQCLLKCPHRRYPGFNEEGIYDPVGSKRRSESEPQYRNYRPFDEKEFITNWIQNNPVYKNMFKKEVMQKVS